MKLGMKLIVLALILGGCMPPVTKGRQFQQAELDKIVLGTTTWLDARKILGLPNHFMDSYNSTETGYYAPLCGEDKAVVQVAQYQYVHADMNGGPTNTANTEIVIDHKGIVCFIKKSRGTF